MKENRQSFQWPDHWGPGPFQIKTPDAMVRAAVDCLEAAERPVTVRSTLDVIRRVSDGRITYRLGTVSAILGEYRPKRKRVREHVTPGRAPRRGWHQAQSHPAAAAGVYAIFDRSELVYIGSSERLRQRLSSHEVLARFPDAMLKVRYTRVPGDHLAAEYRLIRRLRPRLNRVGAR